MELMAGWAQKPLYCCCKMSAGVGAWLEVSWPRPRDLLQAGVCHVLGGSARARAESTQLDWVARVTLTSHCFHLAGCDLVSVTGLVLNRLAKACA